MHFYCIGDEISDDENGKMNDFYIDKAISLGSSEAHYQKAWDLWENIESQEEFNTICNHFRIASENGIKRASYDLAEMNKEPFGFRAVLNNTQIIDAYQKDIDLGVIDATNGLAYFYLSLENTSSVQNFLKYLLMAINFNHEQSKNEISNLGFILIDSEQKYRHIDQKGINEIVSYLENEGSIGDKEAYYQLSILYQFEDNLRDEIIAMKYAKKAADMGHIESQNTYAFYCEFSNETFHV